MQRYTGSALQSFVFDTASIALDSGAMYVAVLPTIGTMTGSDADGLAALPLAGDGRANAYAGGALVSFFGEDLAGMGDAFAWSVSSDGAIPGEAFGRDLLFTASLSAQAGNPAQVAEPGTAALLAPALAWLTWGWRRRTARQPVSRTR